MEKTFEVIGKPLKGAAGGERRQSREDIGLLERFLRGPQRGAPQLDNSIASLLILWLQIAWILLLAVPYILKTLYRTFFRIREKSLRGKVVVITGAGNGLGKELSLQLAKHGCRLACVDIDEKSCKETELTIASMTGRCEDVKSYKCDVSKLEDTLRLAEAVQSDFGHVDILINNAGILYGHTVTGGREFIIRRVIDVNLLSNFWMTRSFLPDMQRRRSGHIVFINSGSGINPIQHSSAYCASKSGLLGLAYCIDEELRRNPDYDDIKITSACPYFIATNPEYVRSWKLRLPPIPVSVAASGIITGIRREYFVYYVPTVRWGYFLAGLIKLLPHEVYKMYKNVLYVDVALTPETRSSAKVASGPDSRR